MDIRIRRGEHGRGLRPSVFYLNSGLPEPVSRPVITRYVASLYSRKASSKCLNEVGLYLWKFSSST